ncbi:hypothetical protein [Saccharothrix obliqua]|uniref:hypothetical protein n=1 Tax=Saccharothrix obliqua TaxID=2861747 RepID=UPI001C5E1FB5|nr:hypothetical protein [Saccharothrix obliqua]MBW4720249.1 hypothetical protein [Saccharothrix obliqua]
MRFVKAVAGVVLAMAAMLGGTMTAGAAPAEQAASTPRYQVSTWHYVNIRSCEATSCDVVGYLPAGATTTAWCWTFGETITDAGITNNIWLLLNRQDGARWMASAVYFTGDQFANLPFEANCDF